ncbi:MAG: hypothetical protein NTY09_02455 [bacterium]|nr:hypothetical protein [bacterium]
MAGHLILSILFMALYIGLLFWVFNDAEENFNAGCLWAILVFFFNLPALAIYLIIFKPTASLPARAHKAVDRNEDFSIRQQYMTNKPRKGRDPSLDTGGTMAGFTPPDSDFSDPALDELIEAGKFSDARDYLDDMLRVAKELNDQKGYSNYANYKSKIGQAQKTVSKKWKYDSSDSNNNLRF